MSEEMWQYTCPKCGSIGAGKPNKRYTCHVCKKVVMEHSSNGRLYPKHGEFDRNCSCERCRIFFGKLSAGETGAKAGKELRTLMSQQEEESMSEIRGKRLKELIDVMELTTKLCERPAAKDSLELMEITKKLYAGNTQLLEALVAMCQQYLRKTEDGGILDHDNMYAGETALAVLEKAGIAEAVDRCNYKIIPHSIGLKTLED